MKSRGLIEACAHARPRPYRTRLSAVKSRGLIEAGLVVKEQGRSFRLSAVKSRGLIEAFNIHPADMPNIVGYPR